jgi:nucleoid DNA-binding protein
MPNFKVKTLLTYNALAKGERVETRGLCSFYVKKYKAYSGRNPKTGDIREIRVKEKMKKLETNLRKNIEINEQSQATNEQSQAKSDISNVIRRRKGEPDKRVSRK